MRPSSARRRKLVGWGFEGESFPPSPQLLALLERRVGRGAPFPTVDPASLQPPAPRRLPDLPVAASSEPSDRLAHARGQGLPDILRLRAGSLPAWPDAVCRPADAGEVDALLAACSREQLRVIPWGGGTSVTGGVNPSPDDGPVVTLDLAEMAALEGVDPVSRLVTFGAGATGPRVEAALAEHGLTLGHFPQSWELSTVGGWVVTRSSGQESLGYGRIDDLVAGLEAVAPAGRLALPAQPGSAAGPDLRRLLLGSEGRLGVVTSITLRVRPRPAVTIVEAALMHSWADGLEAARDLVQGGSRLTMIRLSDAVETEVAMAIGLASTGAAPLVRAYLRLRGLGPESCLLLYGAAGDPADADAELAGARWVIGGHHGVHLGRRPGRHWLSDRFRHPYLRDALLDAGYLTDTLETAATWLGLDALRDGVTAAITGAAESANERAAVLCHVSHPYPDGASLYFTFFMTATGDLERDVARWAEVKRAATAAIVAGGGTISHHHGVGRWHAPWLPDELGEDAVGVLGAAARHLDPRGILNPGVLLDPTDRLEE
ncbi:MAG: FAD-binding oxidoreductase [Acidobacteria bacterium]|nr:FAD-binding oxidoreductase [Acidobacteriota bacterium]